jgi:type IV pilus assembly protein PilW
LNFGVAPDGSLFQQNISNDAGSVMPLESVGWFVGTQGGINSLFRVALVAGVAQIEEVVQNVQDLQLQYLVQGGNDYIDANLVVDWGAVMSIRATLTLADNPAMPMALGIRQISQVINLRNRRE